MGYAHASKADSFLSKTLKAAEQGFAEAQFFLGNMYYEGQGVPKDDKQAVYWLKKSAEQGNTIAKTILNTIKR